MIDFDDVETRCVDGVLEDAITPLGARLAGGCHLNRDTAASSTPEHETAVSTRNGVWVPRAAASDTAIGLGILMVVQTSTDAERVVRLAVGTARRQTPPSLTGSTVDPGRTLR